MRSIFWIVCFLSFWIVRPSLAETFTPLCSDMILQVIERGQEKIITDECPEFSVCKKQDDGKVGYQRPFVRLKVIATSPESDCPALESIYRAGATINEFRVRASLVSVYDEKSSLPEAFKIRNVRVLKGARLPGPALITVTKE